MPYSPDYSDYLKFKRQQTALAVDRQIAERKKRSVVPFSSYNPNYRILSYPPNIFTPSRLLPQPSPPAPQPTTYELTLNLTGITFPANQFFLGQFTFPYPVLTLRVRFENATNIGGCDTVGLYNSTYDFTGTTFTIENSAGGEVETSTVLGNIYITTKGSPFLKDSSVIVYTLPTLLTSLDDLQLNA